MAFRYVGHPENPPAERPPICSGRTIAPFDSISWNIMAPLRLWSYSPNPAPEQTRCGCWAAGTDRDLLLAATLSPTEHLFVHGPDAYPTFALDRDHKPIFWRIAKIRQLDPEPSYVRCVLEVGVHFYQTRENAITWLTRRLDRYMIEFRAMPKETITFPIIDPRSEYVLVVLTRFEVDIKDTPLNVRMLAITCHDLPGLDLLYADGYDIQTGRPLSEASYEDQPMLDSPSARWKTYSPGLPGSLAIRVPHIEVSDQGSLSTPTTSDFPLTPCTVVAEIPDESSSAEFKKRDPLSDMNLNVPFTADAGSRSPSTAPSIASLPSLASSSEEDLSSYLMPASPTQDNTDVSLVMEENVKMSDDNKENIPYREETPVPLSEDEWLVIELSDNDDDADVSDNIDEDEDDE